jgi:hypothetical protein
MKADWKNFLGATGAVFNADGNSVLNFGHPAHERSSATTGSILCDLSHLGLIAAHGVDTQTFLQSQFTNDAREVNATRSQLSGYCSAKGRLLALFRIFQRGEHVYLQLPQELLAPTLKRLRMFVMRAKVTLDAATDTLVRIGFAGAQAEHQLSNALGPLPQAVNEVVSANDVTVLRLPGVSPRFELVGELPQIQALWQQLAVQAVPVGAEVWSLLDILAGVPEVFTSSVEEFVPQMVNLTALGGVNFKKGCYPGQEIVARMQYLGTLKRRMYLAHFDADVPPAAGTPLYEAGTDATQSIGAIVHAQPAPNDGCNALAVVVIAAAERDAVRLGGADGPVLKFQMLPYPLE